jgi:hypothetical protein
MMHNAVFWGAVAAWVLFSVGLGRMPLFFARWALLPLAKGRAVPLPPSAAAVVLHPTEGKASYRDAPQRALALASLPGEQVVSRDGDILHFVSDRNWILARRRKPLSTTLVRVEVSANQGGLVLRARRFPGEIALLVLAGVYLANVDGPLMHHPLSLMIVAAAVAGGFLEDQGHAHRALDAVVDEVHKRIATLDPSYVPPPTPAQIAAAQGLTWTCACGKVNDKERKTCRRCWATKPGSS